MMKKMSDMKYKVSKWLLKNKDNIINIIYLQIFTITIIILIYYFFPIPFDKACLVYAFCITKLFLIRLCYLIIYYEKSIDAYLTRLYYMHVYLPIILILSCYYSFDVFYMVKYLIACIAILDFNLIIKDIITFTSMNKMTISTINPDDSPIKSHMNAASTLNTDNGNARLDPNTPTLPGNRTQRWTILNTSYTELLRRLNNNEVRRADILSWFDGTIRDIENERPIRYKQLSSIKWVASQVGFEQNTREIIHGLSNGDTMRANNGLRLDWLKHRRERDQVLQDFKRASAILQRQESTIDRFLN